jgi:hypothetical protein
MIGTMTNEVMLTKLNKVQCTSITSIMQWSSKPKIYFCQI